MANLSNINGKFVVEQTTGYVGVGTTDPNYPIEVLNASAEIALNALGGSIYRVQSDSASNFIIRKAGVGDRLVIDGSGNSTFSGNISLSANKYILIGTDSGDAFNSDSAIRIQETGNAYVQIKTGTGNQGGVLIGDNDDDYVGGFIYSNSSNTLTFQQNNAAALTISGSGNSTFAGNVGIVLTDTNSVKLGITGNSGLPATSGITQTGLLRLKASNNATLDMGADHINAVGWLQVTDVVNLSLEYNLLLQPNGGNVGIGGTPNDALEVAGNSATTHRIRINNANASGSETLAFVQGTTFKSWVEYNNSNGNFDIWQYTNNNLRFGTNNIERLVIDSSGNATFGGILTVQGAGTAASGSINLESEDPFIRLYDNGASSTTDKKKWDIRAIGVTGYESFDIRTVNDANTVFSTKLSIAHGGNVGIGDASPQGKLEVSQNMSNGAASAFTSPHLRLSALNTTDSTGFVGMTFATSSANNYGFSWGALRTVSALGGMHLRYHANSSVGTDIFNIDYVGNVTIASTRYIRSDSSGGYLTIQGGATFPGGRIDMYGGSSASAGIEFMTGGATGSPTLRLRIDGDTDDSYFTGNLGIGTTLPLAKLDLGSTGGIKQYVYSDGGNVRAGFGVDLSGSSRELSIFHSSSNSVNGDISFGYRYESTGAYYERMRITGGGQLLVGVQSSQGASSRVSAKPLTTSGVCYETKTDSDGYYPMFFHNAAGVQKGYIFTNATSTSYNTSSDYRLKENVVGITGALDRVNQLRPSRFNFIGDADKTVDGFLAHEVQEIVPEAISGEKDAVDEKGNPDYQGIDQSKLVPLLVAAIQELKADNDSLKARIETLENN